MFNKEATKTRPQDVLLTNWPSRHSTSKKTETTQQPCVIKKEFWVNLINWTCQLFCYMKQQTGTRFIFADIACEFCHVVGYFHKTTNE